MIVSGERTPTCAGALLLQIIYVHGGAIIRLHHEVNRTPIHMPRSPKLNRAKFGKTIQLFSNRNPQVVASDF